MFVAKYDIDVEKDKSSTAERACRRRTVVRAPLWIRLRRPAARAAVVWVAAARMREAKINFMLIAGCCVDVGWFVKTMKWK